MDDSPERTRAERRGRTVGTALLGLVLTTFTAVCSVQIIQQAWTPAGSAESEPCREGALSLIHAIRRARAAAASSTEGERAALSTFRQTLEPEWSSRADLARKCGTDRRVLQMLPEIDQLRYAEEHAIRYEALDIASRRLRVDGIARALGESR